MRLYLALLLAFVAAVGLWATYDRVTRTGQADAPVARPTASPMGRVSAEAALPPPGIDPVPLPSPCADAPAYAAAAQRNAQSLRTLIWAPFGRAETGWEIYAPAIADEIATACAPTSTGFAAAIAAWQDAHGQRPEGAMTPELFAMLKQAFHARRPFVAQSRRACPEPPAEENLAKIPPEEAYGGKLMMLDPGALAAWRTLVAAAKREDPTIARDPQMLRIFSAFRSPAYDAERCARQQNCDGVVRAVCSPHRTGRALDVVVGQAPGYTVDSSADPNRLYMTRTPAYRWLVANARRFGFHNYVFEPWHWEWTGPTAETKAG